MSRRILAMIVIALALLSGPARAHEDPVGCFELSIAAEIQTFRSDGVTPVSGFVTGCEQIFYRTTLRKSVDSNSLCAFSGGSFTLTTPDGVPHVVSADVPCIGGTFGEGCDPTVMFLDSGLIGYAVTAADAATGTITANALYTGGVVHDSASNTAGVALSVPKTLPVVACAATTTVTTSSSTTTTTLPARSTCAALKVDAAFQLGADLGVCDSRALKFGVPVREECRSAAVSTFQKGWAMAERRDDCLTTGDEAAVAALMQDCAGGVEAALIP
jgi:hypothetical protein